MKEQPSLFDEQPTVHCFFGRCPHVVSDPDPYAAGRRMEQHYATKHGADLDLIRLRYPVVDRG